MVAGARFVGAIDWSHDEHVLCVFSSGGDQVLGTSFAASGEGLLALRSKLLSLCDEPEGVWIAIETSRGPVVESLLEVGITVFAINPKQADRFRERYHVAPVKDDQRDAWSMARALRTEPVAFRRLMVEPCLLTEIRDLGRGLEEVRETRRKVAQRTWSQLQRYFPQVVKAFPDLQGNSFVTVWRGIPTPQIAATMPVSEASKLLRRAGVRRLTGEELLAILRQTALSVSEATVRAASRRVQDQVEQIELLNRQEKDLRRELAKLWERYRQAPDLGPGAPPPRDVEVVLSVPGVGVLVLATLFGEAWRPLAERNYDQLRALAGAAPVTRSSGKRRRPLVVMRNACHHRLREATFNMARVAVQCDTHWKSHYAALRARGHSHGRALRGLVDRMLKMIVAMLKAGTAYDASKLRTA